MDQRVKFTAAAAFLSGCAYLAYKQFSGAAKPKCTPINREYMSELMKEYGLDNTMTSSYNNNIS